MIHKDSGDSEIVDDVEREDELDMTQTRKRGLQDDPSEDEDLDDEEEDDLEDVERAHRRRKRMRGVNQFVDIMADVDDDEDEIDEEDEEGIEDGFLQKEDLEVEEIERDDRRHRDLDRQREQIEDDDAEAMAAKFQQRYGRNLAGKYHRDATVVSKRLLIPSVEDASIWAVRCRRGMEKELVYRVMERALRLQDGPSKLNIISCFQRDALHEHIYFESRKKAYVDDAISGITGFFGSRIQLVAINEMMDLMRVKANNVDLQQNSWVRIRRGLYAGDLGLVENISEDGLSARVKIVPRTDMDSIYAISMDGKRRKKTYNPKNRPKAKLLNEHEASKLPDRSIQRRSNNSFVLQGEEYEDGFLFKDIKISALTVEGVVPRIEELELFAPAQNGNQGALTIFPMFVLTFPEESLNALVQNLKTADTSVFQVGDTVQITEGEQKGLIGKVQSSVDQNVVVVITSDQLRGSRTTVPPKNLRKQFCQGDHVKVVAGKHKDTTGMVIRVRDTQVTLLTDTTTEEIVVLSKHLGEAIDTAGIKLNSLDLHDLVELKVIDQTGSVQTFPISHKLKPIPHKKAVAMDRENSEIRVGDTVREADGELRQGTILHIHRGTAFLSNRDYHQNSGVFVCNVKNLQTIMGKNGRINTTSGDFKKPNAMPKMIGRDKCIGETVRIRQGPQKGLVGIIKDTTDQSARVELHTLAKTITIDKQKLSFTDRNGNTFSYFDFLAQCKGIKPGRGHEPGSGSLSDSNAPTWAQNARGPGSKTPAWGARTPAYGGGGSGGRTPSWAGGRTPAWNGTAGNTTPSWKAGNATPAWNSGSATPAHGAWESGSRTPAWNSGSRTPAWGATSTEQTEADSGWGPSATAATPKRDRWPNDPSAKNYETWGNATLDTAPQSKLGDTQQTSATAPSGNEWGAPTPGASWGGAASPAYTPVPWDVAPTPGPTGQTVKTPGGWGDEPASPAYAPASP